MADTTNPDESGQTPQSTILWDPNSTKYKTLPWSGGSQVQPSMPGGFTGGSSFLPGEPNPSASTPSPTQAPMVGHDGTYDGMNREQWRDAWMGQGKMSQQQMTDWLTQHGAQSLNGTDKWRTPYGEDYDLGIAWKTGAPTAGWTPISGGMGSAGSGSGGGGFGGSGGGMGGGTTPWSGDPGTNDLMSMLWGRAKQGLAVNRNDPMIANARDAFGATQERSLRNHLDDLAERGGGTGNLALERRMGSEALGQNTAQYESQLILGEVAARRQEIQNALSQMGQFMTEQQRMQLQKQIADMDNMLQRDSLGQRAYEWDSGMNARYQGF